MLPAQDQVSGVRYRTVGPLVSLILEQAIQVGRRKVEEH